jgi:peptidoglycan-associated lipoprotein
MTMRQALVIHVMLLAVLAFGCAKTPATTSGSAPSPTGSATSGASGTGSGSDMRAGGAAGSQGTTGSSARVDPRTYSAAVDLADIHFDFDRYDIRSSEAEVLDKHATWLRQNPDRLILIEGHCDERGTTDYNVALAERRAKATMNYLVSRGVQASRLAIVSYGEERPACKQHSEGCWAQNRRAHFMAKRG